MESLSVLIQALQNWDLTPWAFIVWILALVAVLNSGYAVFLRLRKTYSTDNSADILRIYEKIMDQNKEEVRALREEVRALENDESRGGRMTGEQTQHSGEDISAQR